MELYEEFPRFNKYSSLKVHLFVTTYLTLSDTDDKRMTLFMFGEFENFRVKRVEILHLVFFRVMTHQYVQFSHRRTPSCNIYRSIYIPCQ